MKTYKGIKIGLFVIPRVLITDATPLVRVYTAVKPNDPAAEKYFDSERLGKNVGKTSGTSG